MLNDFKVASTEPLAMYYPQLQHRSRQSGIWHTRTYTKGVLSEMASCYCYVPLPLTILLQITVPRGTTAPPPPGPAALL